MAGVVLEYAKHGNSASRLSVFTGWGGENLSKEMELAEGGLVDASVIISNDMRTAGALYSEIVHLLCANDVRTSDWRINQELGLKPWES